MFEKKWCGLCEYFTSHPVSSSDNQNRTCLKGNDCNASTKACTHFKEFSISENIKGSDIESEKNK